jgi:hypothetical protein
MRTVQTGYLSGSYDSAQAALTTRRIRSNWSQGCPSPSDRLR